MRRSDRGPLSAAAGFWALPETARALKSRDVGRLLRLFTVDTGVSQTRLGEATGLSQGQVSQIMNGGRKISSLDVLERLADGLTMPDHARITFGLAPQDARAQPTSNELGESHAGPAIAVWALEDPFEIARRMARRDPGRLDEAVVERAETLLSDAVSQYELISPVAASRRLVGARQWVEELLTDGPRPRLRHERRLCRVAAGLSGLLGHVAELAGRSDIADVYLAEAWQLATEVDSDELYAWVRGTQSFALYSRGHYQAAWQAAQDGRKYAGRGPQAVRLAVNGEARALGHLGDTTGVARAVDDALALASELSAPASVTSGLSFARYDDARIDGNAATAYVALGAGTAAQEHAERAIAVFDGSALHAPQVLSRLDLAASALMPGENRDLERAAVVAEQAIRLAADRPTGTIRHRVAIFAAIVRRTDRTAALEHVLAMARALPVPQRMADEERM